MKNNWVIVMGSHRTNGYSAIFSSALKTALEVEGAKPVLYDINSLHVEPCIDCGVCKNQHGKCIHQDDMTAIYEILRETTHLVFVSPVYFAGVTSKLKAFVDRLQMVFMCDFAFKTPFVYNTNPSDKKGYTVSFGGANAYPDQFMGIKLTFDLVFRNFRMTPKEGVSYSGTDHWALEDYQTILKKEAEKYARLWVRGEENE